MAKKDPSSIFVVRTAPKIPDTSFPPDAALKKGRQYLVGYVGVMGSADGVGLLLEAAKHAVHGLGRKDVQFLLMGDGPEYDDLIRQRDAMGLTEYVDLPGWAHNQFLFTALKTIDLGVTCDIPNAYNHSCTMNKVLEYMAFAKAQVSFDLKETRASALEAGYYVQEVSAKALAEAIVHLLDRPEERERMGQIGYERLHQQLNWQRSVDQLLAAYQKALR